MEKTVQELIEEALDEARILECALDKYDEDHVLYVAQCLSGAPYSFIEQVYANKNRTYA